MNFTEGEFPSLGIQSTGKQEKEEIKKSATEDPYAGMTKSQKKRKKKKERDRLKKEEQYQHQSQPEKKKEIYECFMCSKNGPAGEVIRFDNHQRTRFLFGRGLCVDCSSITPEKKILYRYVGCDWIDSNGEKEKKLEEWLRKVSKKAVHHITTWVNMDPSRWPCDYPEEVKKADIFEERWESLAYYATWIREKRFRGEKVAWYSSSHGKMVVGELNNIKKDGLWSVFREPETEEEKKLGKFFRKELEEWKMFPPISQKQALILMRNTPGGCRPKEESPFECSGCNRVRISMRPERDKLYVGWSGPNKSPYGGVFCKECYDSNKIHQKDKNMHLARQFYSDREHRAFGSVYVTNWHGKPGKTFRTCSCYKCVYDVPDNPNKSQNYICESCGFKGDGCSGLFDRRSSTGGLPSTWEEEEHWFCKKCWCKEYWVEGVWEHREDGSVWFKPKLS